MKKNLLILLIVGFVLSITAVGLTCYRDYSNRKEFEEFCSKTKKVYIDEFDSMYKVTFGDSTSYLTMEKRDDSLFINTLGIAIVNINGKDDTLRFVAFKYFPKTGSKYDFLYKVKYGDFFDGGLPKRDKIKIKYYN